MGSDFQFLQLPLLITIVDMVIRVGALFIVPRNRRPSSGTAWLLLLFFLPIPGLLLFLVIGSRWLPKKRRERHTQVEKTVHRGVAEYLLLHNLQVLHPSKQGFANATKIAQTLGAFPLLGHNAAQLYSDYHESIRQMAAAIAGAQNFVHLEFYILVADQTTEPIFVELEKAAARGVQVRVLIDHFGALRNPGFLRTKKRFQSMDAKLHYMLPLRPLRGQIQRPDLRNHRKILVIDGAVAFMGSQNLVDPSYNKPTNRLRGLLWKDLMVQVSGPVVPALEAIFEADWYCETGQQLQMVKLLDPPLKKAPALGMQLLPSGPGFATENNLQVFVALMHSATRSISITSPYFIPDGALMSALKAATARGVRVELFVSQIGDQPVVYHAQRSYYEELLQAGVHIYLHKPPVILHAKHFTIDDEVSVIGSSNMDQRSFNLNFEVSLLVHGRDFAESMREITEAYRKNSTRLTLAAWQQQSLVTRLFDNLARLTSALQ